jgi:hypothetical protein
MDPTVTELAGLTAIVENAGTLHSIKDPPVREQFADEDAFEKAYSAWWVQTNCWRTSQVVSDPNEENPDVARPGEWESETT